MNRLQLANIKVNRTRTSYLKNEMFSYHKTKKALKNPDNLTCSEIIYMQNIINAIDNSLKMLESTVHGDEKVLLIQDMYWKSTHYNLIGLSNKHKLHMNTVYYWNKEFLVLFGQNLGLKIF